MQIAKSVLILLVLAVLGGCDANPSATLNARENKVGYTNIEFFDVDRQRPLKVIVWYPAVSTADEAAVTYAKIFKGVAAYKATYMESSDRRPLILLSHGDRGNNANQSWLAELLAKIQTGSHRNKTAL